MNGLLGLRCDLIGCSGTSTVMRKESGEELKTNNNVVCGFSRILGSGFR